MNSLPSTDVINGQMVVVGQQYAFQGRGYGPTPLAYDTYSAQPTTPPFTGATGSTPAGYTAGGSDTANTTAAAVAAGSPFNPKVSPVLWSVLMLLVGVLGLRLIHWG